MHRLHVSEEMQYEVQRRSQNYKSPSNHLHRVFIHGLFNNGSRYGSIGIATRYKLDGPEIDSRCGWDFPCRPDQLRAPPSRMYNVYRVFAGGKAAGVWCWPPTFFQCRVANGLELYLCHPLWACIDMSWGFRQSYLTERLLLYKHHVADVL
jgi:ferredoxin-thioredoxin reductase catalytic subunit